MSFFQSDSSRSEHDSDRRNRFLNSPVGGSGEGGYVGNGTNGHGHGNGHAGNGNGNGGSGNGAGAGAGNGGGVPSLRERAASQPPRTGDPNYFSSPSTVPFVPSTIVGSGSPWSSHRIPSSLATGNNNSNNNNNNRTPGAQPVPIRSSSFSSSAHSQAHFSSTMRERAFPSTFEDDESELLSDQYDERYVPPSLSRGRTNVGHDPSRSRSQSLATLTRPSPIGSTTSSLYLHTPTMQSWNESYLSSNPLNIPGRYGETAKSPLGGGVGGGSTTASRYGSLGTLGVSPSRIHASPSSSPIVGGGGGPFGTVATTNGFSASSLSSSRRYHDVSNMSPFVRDVGEILLDSGSTFRELWAGIPRDESVGGTGTGTTSGTTSRRHSVSVVQPRRGGNNIVGFNAPGTSDSPLDERPHIFHSPFTSAGLGAASSYLGSGVSRGGAGGAGASGAGDGGGLIGSGSGRSGGVGGLMLTDDELASDLGMLNLNPNDPPQQTSKSQFPPSQPSSLPIYAPLSRSPLSGRDATSPYRSMTMSSSSVTGNGIAGGTSSSYYQSTLRQLGTPTEEFGAAGSSPHKSALGVQFETSQQQQQQQIYGTGPGGSDGLNKAASPFINTRVPPSFMGGSATSPLSPIGAGSNANVSTSPTTGRLINPQQQPYYPQRRLSDAARSLSQGTPTSAAPPSASAAGAAQPPLSELGKGIPLHAVPTYYRLFIVEFKAGRTDLFYLRDMNMDVRVGDLVIVEADRGKDLGKVVNDTITVAEVDAWQRQQQQERAAVAAVGMGGGDGAPPTSPGASVGMGVVGGVGGGKKEISPKQIYAKAGPQDTQILATKTQDEHKALQLCQSKVRAKKLPMEVVDAEYQWDRRKLTFYFVAEKRIDFRELVRELFRLYKTRIWMASLQGGVGYEQ
ncbi:hypothetical protein AMATHDRAFT_7296 [Amanita thiersii Skay4041]|uniref:PSP1 C-terminal domain-containing protein n=1 Tax=Amanita thiersii Skay4041 TaxID=703135 RepID=A0A2A9NGP8_9AGAR|nr:hypothetical protein AMATHDRAFT_7296 [Amanita thiersii Skay4041]